MRNSDSQQATTGWREAVKMTCQILARTSPSLFRSMTVVVAMAGAELASVETRSTVIASEYGLVASVKASGDSAIVHLSRNEASS